MQGINNAKMEAIAEVVEQLENDGAGWCAKVRWLYNPIPAGEQLYWPQPGTKATPTGLSDMIVRVGTQIFDTANPRPDFTAVDMAFAAGQAFEEGRATCAEQKPIDMMLYCPECHLQHIDEPDPNAKHWCKECDPENCSGCANVPDNRQRWTNPPHRSHLCHGCGHIWRPADVPTNGVAAVKTNGKADSPIKARSDVLQDAKRWHGWAKAMVEAASLGGVEESSFMLEFERIVGDADGGFSLEQLNVWTDATIAALLAKQGATRG